MPHYLTTALTLAALLSGCSESRLDTRNETWTKEADFGGWPSQSFRTASAGKIVALELSLECRSHPRELLVIIRNSDENGYPMGPILASATSRISPRDPSQLSWETFPMQSPARLDPDTTYTFTCVPSKPFGGFGYFQYAYSGDDQYPAGRLHQRDHGRRVPDDEGDDLCFRIHLR